MSAYVPPFVESQDSPETDPPEYSPPDVESQEVGPVEPVTYVEPFVGEGVLAPPPEEGEQE